MEEHAVELLQVALGIIAASGSAVVLLLGVIASLVVWVARGVLRRMDHHEVKLDEFKETVITQNTEVKTLLERETRLLREGQHRTEVRVAKIESAVALLHPNAPRIDDERGDE